MGAAQPNWNHAKQEVTRWQQALALGHRSNASIADDVGSVRRYGPIDFVEESTEWWNHQAWDPGSWISKMTPGFTPMKRVKRSLRLP
jgi:hypothetical protein